MIVAILSLLGLSMGSFVNALVWRLRQQSLPPKSRRVKVKDFSIMKGRSMCVHCRHSLSGRDLIPVISWVFLKGKCHYCKKPISIQYPAVELITASLFISSYLFWPYSLAGWGWVSFVAWLVCVVGFMALVVYDLRWMLLPNKIIFPLYLVAGIFVLARIIEKNSLQPLWESVGGILIGGGIFYVLFRISEGKWIGGGDVKLGFLLGALLGGVVPALMMLFTASLLGTLVILPQIIRGQADRGSRIPFGPFLIAATVLAQLFGGEVIDWYTASFINI